MTFLRQFSLVVLVSCLAVLAQAHNFPEARYINDQDLSTLIPSITKSLEFLNLRHTTTTTTPKPHKEHIRPVYITYRPPKEDKPSYHHYPYYPYPQPPHHYWPRPEEPTKKPHKPRPTRPSRPTRPNDDEEEDEEIPDRPPMTTTKKPHHSSPGYYPHPSHGSGHPYIIVINPAPHRYKHRPSNDDPEDERTDPVANVEAGPARQSFENISIYPVYAGNEQEIARNMALDDFSIAADSAESDDSETVNTKDVKLPLDLNMGTQSARKRFAQQETLVYFKNFKNGRQLKK